MFESSLKIAKTYRVAQRKVTLFESLQIRQFSSDQAKILNTYASDTNLEVFNFHVDWKRIAEFMQIFVKCAKCGKTLKARERQPHLTKICINSAVCFQST